MCGAACFGLPTLCEALRTPWTHVQKSPALPTDTAGSGSEDECDRWQVRRGWVVALLRRPQPQIELPRCIRDRRRECRRRGDEYGNGLVRVSRYAHSVKFLVTIRRGVSRSSVLRLWLDNHLYRSYGQAYSPEEHSDILDQLVLYRLFTGSKRLAGTCRLQCDG